MRARELGIRIGLLNPGPRDAITDVPGVLVGHATLIEGDGPLVVGHGPIRTGVTVVVPHEDRTWTEPVFAGCHRLNGNGELTGLEWVRESGTLRGVVGITNTHSVGVVRDALVARATRENVGQTIYWSLPVVGETYDGGLNDIDGQHVRPEHVEAALASRVGRCRRRGQRRRRDRDDPPRVQGWHRDGLATGLGCRRRMDRGRARPGELRRARAPAGRWRARRRGDPHQRGPERLGPGRCARRGRGARGPGRARGRLDHRRRRDRCPAAPPPVRATRAARGPRPGADGEHRVQRLGRPVPRLRDGQPGARADRCRVGPAPARRDPDGRRPRHHAALPGDGRGGRGGDRERAARRRDDDRARRGHRPRHRPRAPPRRHGQVRARAHGRLGPRRAPCRRSASATTADIPAIRALLRAHGNDTRSSLAPSTSSGRTSGTSSSTTSCG